MRRRRAAEGGRKSRFVVGLLLLTSLTGACQLVGTPRSLQRTAAEGSNEGPRLEGSYDGLLTIDGGEVRASLQVIQSRGRDFEGVLELSSDFQAKGEGESREGGMEMELRYGGSCPGRMTLAGKWDPAAEVLSGVVQATDCTGRAEGTFRFIRGVQARNPLGLDIL